MSIQRREAGIGGWVAAALLCVAQASCDQLSPRMVMRPVVRFVDEVEQERIVSRCDDEVQDRGVFARGEEARTTVADDVRGTLSPPKSRPLLYIEDLAVPASRELEFDQEVNGALSAAKQLLLEIMIKRNGSWVKLPSQTAAIRWDGTKPRASLRIQLPPEMQEGEPTGVHVLAYARMCAGWRSHETAAKRIPAGAVLEFGIGLAEPGRFGEAAEFQVDACVPGQPCQPIFAESVGPSSPTYQDWGDRRIDLRRFADKDVSFRFRTRGISDEAFRVLPAWADPAVYAPDQARDDEWNVILVSLDTLGAGHLGTYGYEHETAPALTERFAKGGTVFGRCVAAATSTSPSHMAIFSGRQPSANSVTTGVEALPEFLDTITQKIRAAGVKTGAVTEDGWLGVQHGFGRGFDSYVENKSPDMMTPTGQVTLTLEKGRKWLERNREKNFFLFLHTFQVHHPYEPPEVYRGKFPTIGGKAIDAGAPRHLQEHRAYDQEIRFTDDELAKFFQSLEREGLWKNTVVIVLSDHGEEFGEHGWLGHGTHLHEEVTHVPLMMAGGPVAVGRRDDRLVSHVDVPPTILEFFHLPPIPGGDGRSLVPLLRADAGKSDAPAWPERMLFSESWGGKSKDLNYVEYEFDRPAFSVRQGSRKLSRYRTPDGFRYEYYDLATDPAERTDLYLAHAADAADLKQALDGYEAACLARLAAARSEAEAAPVQQAPQMDPRQNEKLKALGYLQ